MPSKVSPENVQSLGNAMAGLGLIGLAFYAGTFITYYDDIGAIEDKSTSNPPPGTTMTTADLPLQLLLQVEALGSIILFGTGMGAVCGATNRATRSGVFIGAILSLICFASTGVYRTSVLTDWFGKAEGTCHYFGNPEIHGNTGDYIKACPTTRHENQKPSESAGFWNISETEPLFRSDCVFWFWDNTFTLESALISTSGQSGTGAGVTIDPSKRESLKNEMLNNMNWQDRKNYGFDNIDDQCENDLGALDCIADGRTVYQQIEVKARQVNDGGADEYGVAIEKQLPGDVGAKQLPDISFCYYWGCNAVCNHYRYRINRVLHYLSMAMALLSLILAGMAGLYSFATPVGYPFSKSAALPINNYEAKHTQSEKWKPMSVQSSNIQKRSVDSRKLRF